MKKYIYGLLSLSLVLVMTGCFEEPENWYSSTTDYDGEWYVRYDHETYGEDPFGASYVTNLTFNTAADDGKEIWLEDSGDFWDYKVKVVVDQETLTFGSEEVLVNQVDDYAIGVKIMNGKIIKNAVTLPSTLVVDSIYYEVWFEDLEGATGIANDKLLVGGYRRTGFEEDIRH